MITAGYPLRTEKNPKLLAEVKNALGASHYVPKTKESYISRIKKSIRLKGIKNIDMHRTISKYLEIITK